MIEIKLVDKWSRTSVALDVDFVYLFGDNLSDAENGYVPYKTQAVIRGLPNAIGICTKRDRYTRDGSYLNDGDYGWFTVHVDTQIRVAINSGKNIALPTMGIGTGVAMLREKAPRCYSYLQSKLIELVNKYRPEDF